MDVRMPDGTIITGVPDDITQTELLARYQKYAAVQAPAAQPPAAEPTREEAPQTAAAPQPADATQPAAAPKFLTGADYLAAVAKRNEENPDRSVSDAAVDAGITLLKGVIGLPESFVGLADIPTAGYIGKILESAGFKPKEAKAILDTYLSEAQQAANRKVREAEGFGGTIAAALQNPSTIATSVGESLPQMIGGAGVARKALQYGSKAAGLGAGAVGPTLPGVLARTVGAEIAPVVAGAAGEGVLGAGSAAEQMRQDSKTGLLSGREILSAIGSGLGTAAFGFVGGRLANKLGFDDIDTLLASGVSKGPAKSVGDFAKKAAASGISEGLFEEMPQSAQEQMWLNYAAGKPLMDGVPEAMGMGLVTGAAMGIGGVGAGSALNRLRRGRDSTAETGGPTEPPERQEPTGLPGLQTPPAGPTAPAAPPTLEEQVNDMLRTAETPAPATQQGQSQDTGAMLRELEAMLSGQPAPVEQVPPTPGVTSGPQAPQAVETEAQEQEAASAPAITGAQPASTQVAPGVSPTAKVSPAEGREQGEERVVGFTTEKGSTYAVGEDGKTARTKRSEGRGQGTTYEPHMALYVSPGDHTDILSDMQGGMGNASVRLGYLNEDKTRFILAQNKSDIPKGAEAVVGVFNRTNNTLIRGYQAQVNPQVGLHPVEKLYNPDGTANTHIGNKIVSLETSKPAAKPRTFEPPAPQNMDLERPIVNVPVSDLKLSEDVPQFKYGANKKGVVEPLGGKFTTEGVAPIAVWQRLDGSLEVISGRHRFDLAQRSGTKSIPAQIYYENQGFTAMDAAIRDAELNIRDDQGKVKDYVNYFKESGTDRATAESKGFLARDKGKRGFAIANQGSDELINALRADQVGDEAAFYIALNAPNDARLQGVGIKSIMDGKNAQTAVNMMQAVKALAGENDTTTDMFGFDDSAMREAEEMAKIAAQKQREVQTRLSAITGAARNPAVAKAEGIDIKDPEAVRRRIDELRQMKAAWENWSTNPELVAEVRAARGVAAPAVTPVLETQTAEDLRKKAEREEKETKREEGEKRKAEQKAKADEESGDFVLTGSDREADEAAARGQEDIFGGAQEGEKKAKADEETAQGPTDIFDTLTEKQSALLRKYLDKLSKREKKIYLENFELGKYQVKEETSKWQGTIGKKEFDGLVEMADASKGPNGTKYIITVKDTDRGYLGITFSTREDVEDKSRIEVFMSLSQQEIEPVKPGEVVDENDSGFIGATDEEVKSIADVFKDFKNSSKEESTTRIFDAPSKKEIVKAQDKVDGFLTIKEAKKRIAEWKKNAKSQRKTGANTGKVILSLFDVTGKWSQPWEDAGYDVYRFDIQTDPEMGDVSKFSAEFFNEMVDIFDGVEVYGILAACPCTDFASSGATHFAAKDASGQTVESVELVTQTLSTIGHFKPAIWAIENPVGRIEKLGNLPPWRLSFNPNHFGDPYTKRTLLWGRFNADLPIAPVEATEGSKMMQYGGKSQATKNARSVTPEGFAYAFFDANNAVDHPAMALANKYDMLNPKVVGDAVAAGLTEQEIGSAVDDAYYDNDFDQANEALMLAIAQKYDELETAATEEVTQKKASEETEKTREEVLGAMKAAQEKQPYMNCQLCVQMATGVTKLLDLPKVTTAKPGDVYTFGERKDMASHYAVDLGNGNVAEVEEWGEPVREIPLADVIAEYGEPDGIRRPPETAYTNVGRKAKTEGKAAATEEVTQEPTEEVLGETRHIETVVKDVAQELLDGFLVGDIVRVGNSSGVVVGTEGDYVRYRPDTAASPKAYRRVQKSQVTLVARPDTSSTSAASKAPDQDKKFGEEQGHLNADMGGLIQLLGANMYASNLADVSIKELLQNAFDAVKGAVSSKKAKSLYTSGEITISINSDDRTITVQDNARGMTPEIVRDAFFTVAGSNKSDLDPSERSGGLGLAKMGFMLGAERLTLDTVRDGVRVRVDTTSKDIAGNNFKLVKSPAPKDEHGTTVTVKIPEYYIDPKNGDQRMIYFPYGVDSIDPLNKPLIGPAKVNVVYNPGYGEPKTKTLEVGTNFDEDKYQKLKANFSWGTADIYFAKDRSADPQYPSHQVLSSGVYQFNKKFALNQNEVIPFDIIVDVKPNVDAKHPDYPFENSRERFKGRLENDVKALGEYLAKIARGLEAADLKENFKNIVSMPRIEAGQELSDTAKKLKSVFDKRGGTTEKRELPPMPTEVSIEGLMVTDTSGRVVVDADQERVKKAEKQKESTFNPDTDAPKTTDFLLQMEQDPRTPIFHNNTNVDFLAIGEKYGDPQRFFAELGTLMVEMKENLGNSGMYGYAPLKPENLFFGGISIDKKYGGLHIKVPYKAVLLNPFYDWGAKSLFGVREQFLNTMIHEIAHVVDMEHGVGHNSAMVKVLQWLADEGLLDYYRDAILDVLVRHESAFTAMREAYGKSTTRNTSKSLEDYGKSAAASADGSNADRNEGTRGAVPAGEELRKFEPVFEGEAETEGGENAAGAGENAGQGNDQLNDNTRRNYRGAPAPLSMWTSPNESNLDSFIYTFADKHIDTKRVQEAITNQIGEIADRFDPYLQEELYHGRVATQTTDFLDDDLRPLIKDMKDRGVTVEEFAGNKGYLHNRAALDRNALIASRNPGMPDRGSGISNEDAEAYMARLSPEKRANFEALAAKIDEIVKGTQDLLVSTGLEKQEVIDNWRKGQPLYVPLNRDPDELDFVSVGTGLGRGFGTRGRSTKAATGSEKTVVDILGMIALQRERAIIRAEKARVGRALYGLAISSPNPEFWMPINPSAIKDKDKLRQEMIDMGLDPQDADNIIQEPKSPQFDKATGQIIYRVNPALRGKDNVFPVRIFGEDRFILFNTGDPRAQRMVQALQNLDAEQLSRGMGIVAELTRTFAALNTQYNPVFGAWNFVRDTTAGAINLNGTPIANRKLEVFRNSFPALRAIYRDLRTTGATTPAMQQWIDLFDRFQKAGGQTGYREQFSRGKEKATVIQRELKNLNAGNARKAAKAVFDWLSDYNDATENAVRLSAFKAALDEGLTEERAASLAKNLTVNFNRKGQLGTWLGSLYAFFNASVQGTARMAKLLVDRAPDGNYKLSKHGKRIIAGGIAIGVFQAVALAMAGYGDDDPPEFLKNKNLIIPIPGGNYLIIPMPLGLNVFPNMGRILTEYAMSSRKDTRKLVGSVFNSVLDTFNPLGSSGLVQTLAPTILDAPLALAENKDPFGRPIAKPDRATNPTPGWTRSRESATAVSKGLAYAVNYLTGGGAYGIGLVTPTADQIDFLAGQYMGGAAREAVKAGRALASIGGNEEVPPYKIPIIGKLYGETTTPAAISDKFYNNITKLAEHEGTIKRMREDRASTTEYRQEYPETRLINRANQMENQISKINKTIKELQQKPQSDFNDDRIKRLKDQKTRMMNQFNEAMSTAVE